jgi:hypothetical protein
MGSYESACLIVSEAQSFALAKEKSGTSTATTQADIVFPMQVRNQLVAEKKAEPHHILPQSGWITFRFRKESDVDHAIELFKSSYEIARERKKE